MIALSPLDEARFGVRTVRVNNLTQASLPEALQFCDKETARFLIARCHASELALVHELEASGFLLMDTLIYYRHRDLAAIPLAPDLDGIMIRLAQSGEQEAVRSVAAQAFRDYRGHYHMDPRLDHQRCDDAYSDWAKRSCTEGESADAVLVAVSPRGLVGFISLIPRNDDEVEGLLLCVSPQEHGRGIARTLMLRAMEWTRIRGAKQFIISTQVTNLAVQRVWVRAGLEPSNVFYTFHRWFDR